MIVEFDRSFGKTLDKIRNQSLFNKLEKLILQFEKSKSLKDLANIKKLTGFKNYYRLRIGEYRIGLEKLMRILSGS